ncbi:Aromatic ring-opening dioxygenase family protein [Lasiodiplodia theobromae]|uniref:Aromatic ring-opening dioxygenase family protein n=1 Tax=Lasiodiplodia theobromae TaxID=45133 RepID=UPI0015C2E3F2|nr:Aromatic ring-opening dioxygenase family protein [Lasiodiplodia theobromae]KAF4537804.1 Aromatic ring-opening dioxygenase family protein [Lasiodiplodia theobromae]
MFSHGSTMMLGEESAPAAAWKAAGDEALRRGIKRIVIMGAHWESLGDGVEVSMNPTPQLLPVGAVRDDRYLPYKVTPDLPGGEKVLSLLRAAGIPASPAPTFDWIHDTFIILIRMFPHCVPPPTVIVSANARCDPHFHTRVGAALRPLRGEDTLLIGSGGTVHNLYRNHWLDMFRFYDNFAQPVPPAPWALEFRQALEDAVLKQRGPELRRAMTRLMKHPRYRDAHGTDDHYMANLFVAGAAGAPEDVGPNTRLAECWELVNMCNTQFQLGAWE